MSKPTKKPTEWWINESSIGYSVFEIQNEAGAVKAQRYPECIHTIHVREVDPAYDSMVLKLVEALEFYANSYMAKGLWDNSLAERTLSFYRELTTKES